MENFREKSHQRRTSCPLIVTDKSSNKFKIYDRNFYNIPFAATASGTPNDKFKRPSAEDDGTRHVTPPEFYPFNELEKDVGSANNKMRVTNSIRY